MTKTTPHFTKVYTIEGVSFYSLLDLVGLESKAEIKSALNGAKFVTIEAAIEGSNPANSTAIIIFPDVYCHAEGLRIFREEYKKTVHDVRAISAGVIAANPTHDEESVSVFGNSLSLQLGFGAKDEEELGDLYEKLASGK